MVEALCVDPARVAGIWPLVSSLIRAALENSLTDFAIIEREVLDGRMLLWLACDGANIRAAAVTQLSQSNGKRFCTIVACGGRGFRRWKHLIAKLEQFARDEGCNSIVIIGRRGWQREYADYKLKRVTLEKELN